MRKNKIPLTPEQKKLRRRKRRTRLFIGLGATVLVLIGLRIALPYIVLHYVNKALGNMKEYYGHVDDIDIALYRGAYVIKEINIMKKVSGNDTITDLDSTDVVDTIPFFSCKRVDLSVEWKSLFKGSIVGKISADEPVVNFVKQQQKGNKDVRTDTADFRQLIKDIMPIKVNKFTILNGEMHYIDPLSNPRVDIFANRIYIEATNLTNVEDKKEKLPAKLTGRASVYGGMILLQVGIDPFAGSPTFDATARMVQMDLKQLNNFMKAYANFDVESGYMNLFAEFAAKDGRFGGYVKPVIKNLDVVEWKKDIKEGSVWQVLYETVIDFAADIFTNEEKEQLATKVVIEGRFDNPGINVWRAIGLVLRNAFIQALKPSIDSTININNLRDQKEKTFLEKLFGSGDKKDQKEKKKNKKKK